MQQIIQETINAKRIITGDFFSEGGNGLFFKGIAVPIESIKSKSFSSVSISEDIFVLAT